MWHTLLWVGVAGAFGTLCRYGVSAAVQKLCGPAFPWGTFAVNAAGCFLFGVVWALAEERLVISGQTRFVILTGFMGAFTTFSTFAFETGQFLRDAQWLSAAANVAGQNVLGVACVFLGLTASRLF